MREKNPPNVIIADFNEDNGVMISKILKNLGCNVKIAHNTDMFKDALNDSPSLVVIDDPVTEFIELLRKKSRVEIPKLVLLSRDRYSDYEKEMLAEKLNMVELLEFPFDVDEFEKKVSCHI